MDEGDNDVVEAKEAAALLGVSRPTLYRLVETGQLPRIEQHGLLERKRLRFHRHDIELLLREGRRPRGRPPKARP